MPCTEGFQQAANRQMQLVDISPATSMAIALTRPGLDMRLWGAGTERLSFGL